MGFINHKKIHFGSSVPKFINRSTNLKVKVDIDIVYNQPRVLVAVVVYNRFENMVQWINCWNQCEQGGATFLIIHNHDPGTDISRYRDYCLTNGVNYYARPNRGYDIGAFQDIVNDRIRPDLSWDILFWCTDDTIPMKKDFLTHYINAVNQSKVGVSCMHVSNAITRHMRTTGFCIKKAIAKNLVFIKDSLQTKSDCYFFEHSGHNYTILKQIENMNNKVIQITPIENSLVWDPYPGSCSNLEYDRWAEHHEEFPKIDNTRVQKICITTVFDRNYKEAGRTMFNSIKKYTDCTGIDFKIITADPEVVNEFGEENCYFITEEIKTRYTNVKYGDEFTDEKYSSSWYRYEIFNMTDYDRVICIDSDCICVKDISFLFSRVLSQYDLISVEDHIVSKLTAPANLQNPKLKNLIKRFSENKIDIQPALLVANKNIINESWYKKLLNYANTTDYSYSIDEGVLNDFIYMENLKIKLLPLEWDYQDLYEIHCSTLPVPSPIIIHCQESKPFKKQKGQLDYKIHKWHEMWTKEASPKVSPKITAADLIDYSHQGHNTDFKSDKKVTFIVPIFNSFPSIIGDLILQSHSNWELLLIHDGPNSTNLQKLIDVINDPRIIYVETPERKKFWGHSIRKWAIEQIRDGVFPKTDFIVVSNPDNHHTIPYISKLIQPLVNNPNLIGSYCSQMTHNYIDYGVMEVSLTRGFIDCASAVIRADAVCNVGWQNLTHISADWFYIEDIFTKYGKDKFVKVKGCLMVHN